MSLGIQYTCQNCKQEVKTTRNRSLYAPEFVGSCGDSFCYRSCDLKACHSFNVTVCDDCAPKLGTANPIKRNKQLHDVQN